MSASDFENEPLPRQSLASTEERGKEGEIPEQEKMAIMQHTNHVLQKSTALKTEELRQLKLVKMYSEKHDLSTLQNLITKWRNASQEILQELQTKLPDPKPSIEELLSNFGIDASMVNYDIENETFH